MLCDEHKALFDFTYQFDGTRALHFVGFAMGMASEPFNVKDWWTLLTLYKTAVEKDINIDLLTL